MEKWRRELRIFKEKSTIMIVYLFSILISLTNGIGKKIDLANKVMYNLNIKEIIRIIIQSGVVFGAAMVILICIRRYQVQRENSGFRIKRWIITAIVILVCWLPYFLMFFPGSLSSDSYVTINQILGNYPLNNHHPIMFTLFVKIWMSIGMAFGGIEMGIAFYSVVQMMIMAFSVSAIVEWMKMKSLPKLFSNAVLVLYAVDGIMAIYSFTMWKDILFSIWIVLLVLYLYELGENKREKLTEKKTWYVLTVFCFLLAFSRNNGLYVVVMFMAGLVVCYRKYWKQISVRALLITAAIMFLQGPVYSWLDIGKGNFAESLGVPLQQFAYTVYHDGVIEADEKAYLEQLIPIETMKSLYNPVSADPIKFSDEFDNQFLEENKAGFFKTWAKMLPRNLSKYIKGYCMHTSGYWYKGFNNWRCFYGAADIDNLVKVENRDYVEKITGRDFKERVSRFYETRVNEIPIVKYLFNIAFSFWAAVFCLVVLLVQKQGRKTLALLPIFAIWLTLMVACPVYCEFRYMFAFHLALPIMGGMVLLSGQVKKDKRGEK